MIRIDRIASTGRSPRCSTCQAAIRRRAATSGRRLSSASSLPIGAARAAGDRSTVWDAAPGCRSADHCAICSTAPKPTSARPGRSRSRSEAARGASATATATRWEQLVFARQQRLSRAAVAGRGHRWTHVDRRGRRRGQAAVRAELAGAGPPTTTPSAGTARCSPTVTDPFLDLGAGEVVGQLAWIDHLLGAPARRALPGRCAPGSGTRRACRVLEPFVRRRDWHWLGLDGDVHNWNPWIHGNVLVAALRLLDEPTDAQRAEVVDLVIEGLDRYVASLPADGAIDEGYAYWWNGACRALEALDILAPRDRRRCSTPIARSPALRETVAFPHRMHLGGEWYLNLADGPARPPADQPWHALHRAARRVGDRGRRRPTRPPTASPEPAAPRGQGLGRLLRGDDGCRRGSPQPAAARRCPGTSGSPSTQVLVARERGRLRGRADPRGQGRAQRRAPQPQRRRLVRRGRRRRAGHRRCGPADVHRADVRPRPLRHLDDAELLAQRSGDLRDRPGHGCEYAATEVEADDHPTSASLSLDLAPAYPLPGLRAGGAAVG